MDPNNSLDVLQAQGWREYGFSSPDELIAVRRAYGGLKDEYNPILRNRRFQSQTTGACGGLILGAILGYLVGKDRHC